MRVRIRLRRYTRPWRHLSNLLRCPLRLLFHHFRHNGRVVPGQINREALPTVRETASVLHVSTETIRRRLKDGQLHGVRLGKVIRVPASEVDRVLRGNRS
jgi:excisionase family DNA binding protein